MGCCSLSVQFGAVHGMLQLYLGGRLSSVGCEVAALKPTAMKLWENRMKMAPLKLAACFVPVTK